MYRICIYIYNKKDKTSYSELYPNNNIIEKYPSIKATKFQLKMFLKHYPHSTF